jgi:sulfite reductase (ferredoxin)
MLRIRVPGGALFPHQLRCAAAIARTHGNGRIHVTTRQDIQVHDVPLDGIYPALVELTKAGLSTKGGGGNTVRNIMGCPDAGVCPDEVFDITPYPVALTEFMLPDPVSYQLPRKYIRLHRGLRQRPRLHRQAGSRRPRVRGLRGGRHGTPGSGGGSAGGIRPG